MKKKFEKDLELSIYKRLGDEVVNRARDEAIQDPQVRDIVENYKNKIKGELVEYIKKNYR